MDSTYTGHVEDIDLHFYRGAYRIKELKIENISGEVPVPFIDVEFIDISIEWRQLFRGKIVGEVEFHRPQVNFVKGPTEAQSQTTADTSMANTVDKWVPVKINRLAVYDGEIHYRDFHSEPPVDVMMTEIQGEARNLRTEPTDTLLPSDVKVRARLYDEGEFRLNMALNPFAQDPTFDLNAAITQLNLVRINDFLMAYSKVDAEQGQFEVYMEMASKEGRYSGYVKPLLLNAKILDLEEDFKKRGLGVIWEAVVAGVLELFTNQPEDQLAAKVPFEGSYEGAQVNIWFAVGTLLRNAFISALEPSLDYTIQLNNEGVIEVEDDKPRRDKKQ
jgi:hypothetical protein